jgi:hypothetical protein
MFLALITIKMVTATLFLLFFWYLVMLKLISFLLYESTLKSISHKKVPLDQLQKKASSLCFSHNGKCLTNPVLEPNSSVIITNT